MVLITQGSSLTFSAQGGRGKEKYLVAAKNPVRPRKNTAEGGCGGNSAVFLQKIEAKPAALLVQSRTQQKSFLFLLEEKIRRAQNQKCRENFFAGWRVVASGGGLASLVPFKVGSREVYNYSTKTNFVGIDCSARRVRRAPQGKIRFCFRRKIPPSARPDFALTSDEVSVCDPTGNRTPICALKERCPNR